MFSSLHCPELNTLAFISSKSMHYPNVFAMKKITKVKLLSISTILLLLSLITNSCSIESNKSQEPELEFWTMQLKPDFTEYFAELISDFEAENTNVKIRWIDVPWTGMKNKIITAVAARTAPDVVNLNPNFASQLAQRKAWLNLEDLVPVKIQKEYLANIWQASTIKICTEQICDNSTFAVPWYLTTRITIYNQDLFQKAKIEKAPQTYQELAEVAAKIKQESNKYAFFITFVPGDSTEVLESLVQMGVKLVDEEGKAAFNTPEGIAAFRYWVNLYQKGLLPPEVLTQGHRYGIELYQAGETALLASGPEFLESIALSAPSIAKMSATAPQITGKTGLKNVAVMNLAIPRDTDNPEKAVEFALYVTNTENQLAFAKAAKVLPSTVAGIEKYLEELNRQTDISPVEKAMKVSASQIKDARVLIQPRKNLNLLHKIIYENLQSAMLQQKTVERAIEDAASEWNQITSK